MRILTCLAFLFVATAAHAQSTTTTTTYGSYSTYSTFPRHHGYQPLGPNGYHPFSH